MSGRILAIESSCDETAVAVVERGRRILADVVASQTALHAATGGIVPEVAARAHLRWMLPVLERACADAGIADLATLVEKSESHFPEFAALLIGLISSADDEGRFLASQSAICGYLFPHDDVTPKTLRRWLDEIQATGIVQFYSVNKREYGVFPKWLNHQKINRPQASSLPPPPSDRSK